MKLPRRQFLKIVSRPAASAISSFILLRRAMSPLAFCHQPR